MTGAAAPPKAAGGDCDSSKHAVTVLSCLQFLLTIIKGAQSMNRKELVDALATKTSLSKADTDRAIGALIEIISDTLTKGESLSLVGFGSFEVRKRAARTGRNPKTGEELKIKAAKVPAFKAGATLKAAVNSSKK
jgi:DNA-binding protein HU-beta